LPPLRNSYCYARKKSTWSPQGSIVAGETAYAKHRGAKASIETTEQLR
jgi:hypothetical protein